MCKSGSKEKLSVETLPREGNCQISLTEFLMDVSLIENTVSFSELKSGKIM
jgi:hypothetical protein